MDSKSSIDSSMMFDWNDQVGGMVPYLMVSEDHIVPYPMETEDDALFPSGDYSMNRKNEAATADVGSIAQSSWAKNDDLSSKSESRSSFYTSEELSSSRTDMDPWFLDFPNICIELRYDSGNNHSSVTELMNDLSDATNLNSLSGDSMQLDCEPELLGQEDKENGDLLDCDWDTFGDFDDIENLFRKDDAMFGHDVIGNADRFLSPSTDVINGAAQSIPLLDLQLCNDQALDEGCSSFQLDDHSEKQRSPLREEMVDEQKITRGSENKAEGRRKRPSYNNTQLMPSENVQSSDTNPFPTFQSDLINQQMQLWDAKLVEPHGSDQVSFIQHGYPTYCFSGMQFPPHFQDKLRRLQKMQARHTIEQQHKQHAQTCFQSNQALDTMISTFGIDERAQRVSSSELNMLAEKDESKGTSSLTYDSSLEETVYYQLRDVVEKLDVRIRLCIRDSLLRLARSTMERRSASDRGSSNKCSKDEDEVSLDEELRDCNKSTTLADPETDTNPIDRIVASLLFQGTTEAHPRAGLYELISSTYKAGVNLHPPPVYKDLSNKCLSHRSFLLRNLMVTPLLDQV